MTVTAAAPGTRGASARRRGGSSTEPLAYDFRRPIQLSREHQRILVLAFDNWARTAATIFTSSLRTISSLTLQSIEQRAYNEYIDTLGPQTFMVMFSADPIPGKGAIELPVFAAMSCIDHMLGGPGSSDQPDRPLTEIESGVMKSFIERLLQEVKYSLGAVVDLDPVVTGIEYAPQFAQIAGAADVMVVATFELMVDERDHRMTIVLPFSGLVTHLNNASGQGVITDRERAQRARSSELVHQQLEQVPVSVAVRFRPTRLDPIQLSGLKAGDVLRLNHPAAAPLDVTIDDEAFAHATAGARGQRLAALIVDTPKEQ